ncbi:MAG: TetR/AcrR family transcriptional regulator [Pseudomonadales bacterium]|nr:TetR/AcrR family transcriptional regulator [Pseudomonadales bacterium]
MTKTPQQETKPQGSRRELRKQAFREKIMQAAIQLFEEVGCDETTLEDICKKAGVSRPTFYSYYPTKQDLIQAMAEKLWLNVAEELTSEFMGETESPRLYVVSFIALIRREFSKYNQLERDLIRHSMSAGASESSNMNILHGLTELFAGVYQQGFTAGDISDRYPIDFLAEMTMASISTVMMNWAIDEQYPIDKRLDQLADYIPRLLELN